MPIKPTIASARGAGWPTAIGVGKDIGIETADGVLMRVLVAVNALRLERLR